MSMKWAIPDVEIREGMRRRREDDYEKIHKLKFCSDCNRVYKKADFIFRQYRNIKEEHYGPGLMPTYGLERKQCLGCKEKVDTDI